MKDFLIVVVILLIGAGWVYFTGYSHSKQFEYDCGILVPWYDAFFLDAERCPGASNPNT